MKIKLKSELKPASKPIHTKTEHEAVLREVAAYFDNESAPSTADGDRFEILVMLIENYEAKHRAILPPGPIEAIKFRMEQASLTPRDLESMIGGRTNRVYEVLTRKRPLTLAMIRRLHAGLGIPAESLIADVASASFLKIE